MNQPWYRKKSAIVLLHALVWLLFFLLPILLRPPFQGRRPWAASPVSPSRRDVFTWFNLFTDCWLLLVFYFNTQVLVPAFMSRGKYLLFALCHLCIFGGLLSFNYFLFRFSVHFPLLSWRLPLEFILFPYLLVVACGLIYRLVVDRVRAEEWRREGETENLKTELALLRLQVSPHFMFNVLNNMVALARKQSDQLEPSLIRLSSLMRYMLYEADGKVLLEKEIEYLQSYIDLQCQRFSGTILVDVQEGDFDPRLEIEPMLLVPFVENAFKHGSGWISEARIQIGWETKGKELFFQVKNKYNPEETGMGDKTSGIGLANVQRRLQLLYRDHQHLVIRKDRDWFQVDLQILLQ